MTEKQLARQREKEEKARLKLEKEIERTRSMMAYEEKFGAYGTVCGIDEAGRGPLAGPVVAGACILPDHLILYLNDSKKLSAKKRDELYEVITHEAASWAVGISSPSCIDDMGILGATYEAMRQAVSGLSVHPDLCLNDAVTIPDLNIRQIPIIHGDALSCSIAAASILAKVTRDRIMLAYDKEFPDYGFARHKGYGTAEHKKALQTYGPTKIHRMQFVETFLSH